MNGFFFIRKNRQPVRIVEKDGKSQLEVVPVIMATKFSGRELAYQAAELTVGVVAMKEISIDEVKP